jgi:hypothetical protein
MKRKASVAFQTGLDSQQVASENEQYMIKKRTNEHILSCSKLCCVDRHFILTTGQYHRKPKGDDGTYNLGAVELLWRRISTSRLTNQLEIHTNTASTTSASTTSPSIPPNRPLKPARCATSISVGSSSTETTCSCPWREG